MTNLLKIDDRDRAGLEWIEKRSRFWLTGHKRRRKYRPRQDFSPEEMELLRALVELERAAKALLSVTD